jgi:hypothetical protein
MGWIQPVGEVLVFSRFSFTGSFGRPRLSTGADDLGSASGWWAPSLVCSEGRVIAGSDAFFVATGGTLRDVAAKKAYAIATNQGPLAVPSRPRSCRDVALP